MWHCKYAKEPFNARLFALRCLQNAKWILVSLCLGVLLIGGGYFFTNAIASLNLPYEVVTKYYVEYDEDPDTGYVFSYFTAYAWDDWLKSEKYSNMAQDILGWDMPKEEFGALYQMGVPADIRMPYLTVTHKEKQGAEDLANALSDVLKQFGEEQQEILSVEVVDVIGPKLVKPDIRTFRACVLGAIVGTFFALFTLAIKMIVDGGIYLPETFTYRYKIPAVGSCDLEMNLSKGAKENWKVLAADKSKIAITSLEEDTDIANYKALLGMGEETVCIPSILQVPEASEKLAQMDAVLLLVKYGTDNMGAIEEALHTFDIQGITITGMLLVEADGSLISWYRGRKG